MSHGNTGAEIFYWSGNKNIPQDQQTGYYERGATSYYFNNIDNWFIKKSGDSVGNTFGYRYEVANRAPRGNDTVYFTRLKHNPEIGISGNHPTNPCLFGGLSGASGISGGQTWFGATGTEAQMNGWLYRVFISQSYGSPFSDDAQGNSFNFGNTFGTTYGKDAFISGISASTTISGLTGLSGNTGGKLVFTNYDGTSVNFGVSAGISFAGSGQTYAGGPGDGTTLIGTNFIYGNTFATRSVYLALNAAITAGTLKMTITDYTGAGDTEFTLTQNIPGPNGNRAVGGSLLTATGGVVGGTMGITVGKEGFITGGRGITEENPLRLATRLFQNYSNIAVNLVDSRIRSVGGWNNGQFNYKRGYIHRYSQYRKGDGPLFDQPPNLVTPETSSYIFDTHIGEFYMVAGGTYANLQNVGSNHGFTYQSEDRTLDQPISYIRASGGIPWVSIHAFRRGTVIIENDVTKLELYPEQPWRGNPDDPYGTQDGDIDNQGSVVITRRFDNPDRFNIGTLTLWDRGGDPVSVRGHDFNNTLTLACGLTIESYQHDSGTVRVGNNVGDRHITIVDGNIKGSDCVLQAWNTYVPEYKGFKIGGHELSTGVTLPDGLLISSPEATIQFSPGHYVLADFLGNTGIDAAVGKGDVPLPVPPPAFPGA